MFFVIFLITISSIQGHMHNEVFPDTEGKFNKFYSIYIY